MPKNKENTVESASCTAAKKIAKRKFKAARYFVDKYIDSPVVITPKWQRAIDAYNRAKGNTVTR